MSHSQFKVFKGKLESFQDLKKQIESFVDAERVSARSIGIEFIEHSKEIFISLGYSKDGTYMSVNIDSANLGKVDLNDTATIESLMSAEAEKRNGVICHELCITDTNEFMMIFMSATK